MQKLRMLFVCVGGLALLCLPAPALAQVPAPGHPCLVLSGYYYRGSFQQSHDWSGTPVILSSPMLSNFLRCDPLPEHPGTPEYYMFTCDMDATLDIGGEIVSFHSPATVTMLISLTSGMDYDAELVELSAAHGTLPPGCMIRESPTQVSIGKVSCTDVSWGYVCDSFFDVFTDVSLDGGQSWASSQTPGRLALRCDDCPVPTQVGTWGTLKAVYR
jgi:hypothetical protein